MGGQEPEVDLVLADREALNRPISARVIGLTLWQVNAARGEEALHPVLTGPTIDKEPVVRVNVKGVGRCGRAGSWVSQYGVEQRLPRFRMCRRRIGYDAVHVEDHRVIWHERTGRKRVQHRL